MKTSNYEVRKYKSHKTTDWDSFHCELFCDGKKIADVYSDGNGGCYEYRFTQKGAEEKLREYCASLPKFKTPYSEELLDHDFDTFLSNLIDALEKKKKIARLCKKYIVYELKSKPESIMYRHAPYTPTTKALVEKDCGADLQVIFNETINA